jgi:hypothetical protein
LTDTPRFGFAFRQADVALDVWPRWLRRQIAGVALGRDDLAKRRDLIDGLDALAGHRGALTRISQTRRCIGALDRR